MNNELYHHGRLGQRWGIQNGPPYPLDRQKNFDAKNYNKHKRAGGLPSPPGGERVKHYRKDSKGDKQHVDKTIKSGTEIHTITEDKDAMKRKYFYASYTKEDRARYVRDYTVEYEEPIIDENGFEMGTKYSYNFDVSAIAKTDIKVASEDSKDRALRKLIDSDEEFADFCKKDLIPYIQKSGNYSYGLETNYEKPYKVVSKLSSKNGKLTDKEVHEIGKLFSFSMGFKSRDEELNEKAMKVRGQLFNELKKEGYGALLDTNNALYYKKKTDAPVIVFDMSNFLPSKARELTLEEWEQSGKDLRKYRSLIYRLFEKNKV